jgi:limonene-1,2-epoxide hydrolase
MILPVVTRSCFAALLVASVCSACGGGSTASPERIVRSWSAALNAGDNERAASLFAHDAHVVQGNVVLIFHTRAEAVVWNASLPCSGRIVALHRNGDEVTATFVLGDRTTSACDGPGARARALFRVQHGKIVLWHQLPSGGSGLPQV